MVFLSFSLNVLQFEFKVGLSDVILLVLDFFTSMVERIRLFFRAAILSFSCQPILSFAIPFDEAMRI